nr:PREDICTED: ATP-dependent DNA helicase PIF1 [Latimeria chalumnae]|eukprot:XP_014339442.1 PREDICTED: ATP-dependent DNA helicase PIF1 [Latimeria chalumnae]
MQAGRMPSEDLLNPEVQCSVTIECLNLAGQAIKRRAIRSARLVLGRNEFRELVLLVDDGKLPQRFALREIQLFTRFVRDGKSTIKLLPENVQVLLSNCPMDKLKVFIRTLAIKYEAGKKDAKPVSDRMRLTAGLPRSFETVSPLQARDVELANEQRAKVNVATPVTGRGLQDRGPNGASIGQVKRQRTESSKNCLETGLKRARKPMLSMPTGAKLSTEQSLVLSAVLSGKNVFFTGSAGTGKSYLLKRIVGALPPKSTYATASTGVAACHIGGTTLHAFAGIGSGNVPLEQCVELARRPGVLQHWISCRHLIIDEISMVEGEFFDKLEAVARVVRRRDEPFGGIQLIVCGDFLQLPPVTRAKEGPKFCFQVSDSFLLFKGRGELQTYEAVDSDPMLVKTINRQCPVGQVLQLKKGAQVMLAKNLDVQRGLVNGARGVVVGFQSEAKGVYCGMSLDCVEISLARVFESGQAYVALSRARSLEGLRVLDFDPRIVRADPNVLQFYDRLQKERLLMQSSMDDDAENRDPMR